MAVPKQQKVEVRPFLVRHRLDVVPARVESLGEAEQGDDKGAELNVARDVKASLPADVLGDKASNQGRKLRFTASVTAARRV